MTSKYFYKGIDITLDVYEKLAAVVGEIALRDRIGFDEAFVRFAPSRTYEALSDPRSLMWSESVPFIVDEYQCELV